MNIAIEAPILAVPDATACAEFARRGVLRWHSILDADELLELRDEYDRVMALADAAGHSRNLAESSTRGAAPQQMMQVLQLCERSLAFRRLIYDPRIVRVVQALIGPDLMLFHDQALFKPAFSGGAVDWHQDNGYWSLSPARAVSCWLTLDDADRCNGTMQLVPGSHLAPLAHGSGHDHAHQLIAPKPAPEDIEIIDVPAGGCLFHHCQTLHYTAPNTTARQRRAFAIHYMPVGTRDRDGQVLTPGWSRPLVSLSAALAAAGS